MVPSRRPRIRDGGAAREGGDHGAQSERLRGHAGESSAGSPGCRLNVHGRTLDTERFGGVTLHVLPAQFARRSLRLMTEAALRGSLSDMSEASECVVAWTGTRPGPSWDIPDEFGRRHRP